LQEDSTLCCWDRDKVLISLFLLDENTTSHLRTLLIKHGKPTDLLLSFPELAENGEKFYSPFAEKKI
jgi:hypothetical protein